MAQVPIDRTLYDVINELRPQWERRQVQGHLARFGFSGDEAQRRAETLSGGERARVALAMMVLTKANFLLLDEPTNHLDIESIEALEDALEEYEGTILLVSHDRAMLEALTSRVWILHDQHITDFPGSFTEWEEQSREREHAAAVSASEQEALRRVKERKTTRRRRCRETTAGSRFASCAERLRIRREKWLRWRARLQSLQRFSRIRSSTRHAKEQSDHSSREKSSTSFGGSWTPRSRHGLPQPNVRNSCQRPELIKTLR